jgi:hypothetical protein
LNIVPFSLGDWDFELKGQLQNSKTGCECRIGSRIRT